MSSRRKKEPKKEPAASPPAKKSPGDTPKTTEKPRRTSSRQSKPVVPLSTEIAPAPEPNTKPRKRKKDDHLVETKPFASFVSPKKGRQIVNATIKKDSIRLPINDALDAACLAEYGKATTTKEVLMKYRKTDEILKFVGGAMRCAGTPLGCPGCKSVYASHTALASHIQRCAESASGWELVYETMTMDKLKVRPWRWVNITPKGKKNMVTDVLAEQKKLVCPRAADCGTSTEFTDATEALQHLDGCCAPNYMAFKGHPEYFREMPKKDMATLIRVAMTANGGELPCLSCGKLFNHRYGLNYHLNRCGFSAEDAHEMPWNCYRCGFEGNAGERDDHLDRCRVPASAVAKRSGSPVAATASTIVLGRLDANLRVKREASAGVNSAEDLAAAALLQFESPTKDGEPSARKRKRASVVSGQMPDSGFRITSSGLKRFKFRKSEAMSNYITVPADLQSYQKAAANAWQQYERRIQETPICPSLVAAITAQTLWREDDELSPYLRYLLQKQSVSYRTRRLADYPQSKDKQVTANASGMLRVTIPPPTDHPQLPGGLQRLRTFDTDRIEKDCSCPLEMAYTGGPINTIRVAPNPISEDEECVAVVAYPDDGNLIGSDGSKNISWRTADAHVQLWRLKKEKEKGEGVSNSKEAVEDANTRCSLSLWCVVRVPGSGLCLAAEWMPRAHTKDDQDEQKIVGYLALATANGSVSVYGIRSDIVPTPSADGKPVVVTPQPLVVLKRPADKEAAEMRAAQRAAQNYERKSTLPRDLNLTRESRKGRDSARERIAAVMEAELDVVVDQTAMADEQRDVEWVRPPRDEEEVERKPVIMDLQDPSTSAESTMDMLQQGTEIVPENQILDVAGDENAAAPEVAAAADAANPNEQPPKDDKKKKRRSKLDPEERKARKKKSGKDSRKAIIEHLRAVKAEADAAARPAPLPVPPAPVTRLAWCPFGSSSRIAAVDAMGLIIVWDLEERREEANGGAEGMEEGTGEEAGRGVAEIRPHRIFLDINWQSPPQSIAWLDEDELSVGFAEKCVRVLSTETGECRLEELTVRTAGKAVASCPPLTGGIFTYQSEYYSSPDAPETSASFLAFDHEREGYFVVPLSNRHALMVWDVAVSPSGVIASAGCDGRAILSMNGKIAPRFCMFDLSVHLHEEPLLLIRHRVTPAAPASVEEAEKEADSAGEDKKKEKMPPTYHTHDLACENMWLDIVADCPDKVRAPSLPQACLDLRIESLNAIAVSSAAPGTRKDDIPAMLTGGQAGFLFARPFALVPKTVQNARWTLAKRTSSTPGGSKEGTPRPISRASKERTPAAKRDETTKNRDSQQPTEEGEEKIPIADKKKSKGKGTE